MYREIEEGGVQYSIEVAVLLGNVYWGMTRGGGGGGGGGGGERERERERETSFTHFQLVSCIPLSVLDQQLRIICY